MTDSDFATPPTLLDASLKGERDDEVTNPPSAAAPVPSHFAGEDSPAASRPLALGFDRHTSTVMPLGEIMVLMRDALRTAKRAFDAISDAAAHAVTKAVLADVRSGVLPVPSENPEAIEQALVQRAGEARMNVRHVGWDGQWYFEQATVLFARTSPADLRGSWDGMPTTPVDEFTYLRVSGADAQPSAESKSPSNASASPVTMLRLQPGAAARAADCGFTVEWTVEAYAERLWIEDVLTRVAGVPTAKDELHVSPTWKGIAVSGARRRYHLPIRVCAPPVPPPPPVVPAQRRQRRTARLA